METAVNGWLYIQDESSGKRYQLRDRIITIGSSEDCIIRLAPPCPAHAGHFLFIEGAYRFQSLTEDVQVLVNEKPLKGRHAVGEGDRICIGSVCLRCEGQAQALTTGAVQSDPAGELIEMVLLLLRNRDRDISAHVMSAVSRLLRSDAARIVSEDPETGERHTLIRYPSHAGLDRFSNRAIDWARDASCTILMLEPDWQDSPGGNRSLEKNAVSSILCAPLRGSGRLMGFLYLDRIRKSGNFTEEDRAFCDRLLPLFGELLINSEEKQRQNRVIAALQEAQAGEKGGIVYRSERMRAVISLATKIATTDAAVLILGETGTGKELVARHIHSISPRSEKPFKAVNCGAIPENLIESELFGHEKGAFTGAHVRKAGLFESAEGGTVFLDEIGEMPPSLQVKLLRVLQESEIVRVGGTDTVKVDVRIIAATNRDLKNEVEKGAFRSDLYFRLNVLSVTVPPLRDRNEDILLLAEYFTAKYCTRMGLDKKILTADARQSLAGHLWPGNVRELENVIQKAVIMSSSGRIGKGDLEIARVPGSSGSDTEEKIPSIHAVRERAEKEVIRQALRATMGNISQTSRILEIDRKWLFTKMNEYGIDAERYRKATGPC